MKKILYFLCILIAMTPLQSIAQPQKMTEQAAQALGTDAYIYAYPLVLMQITKQVMTNVPTPNANGQAPTNQFSNVTTFATPDFKDVVRPNVDTLYTIAWLDLSKEPVILTLPNTHDRYYVMPLLDAWSDVFISLGKRTTGTKAGNFAVIGSQWKGTLPKGIKSIKAPTNTVWIMGRTQMNNNMDFRNVCSIQCGYKLTPLSQWGKNYTPQKANTDSAIDMNTPPSEQVLKMDATQFFKTFANTIKTNSPAKADQAFINSLKPLGIEPGKDFDISKLSPDQVHGLVAAVKQGQNKIAARVKTLGENKNGWLIMRSNIGDYSTHFLDRAAVAQFGLGANLPVDAIYPSTSVDAQGNKLVGSHPYVLHFSKDEIPPVNAFWSVTVYNTKGFLVSNTIDRYSLGSRDSLHRNADGSLDIYIQYNAPTPEKMANWLPAPKDEFSLTLRLYWPKTPALNGQWNPPGVRKGD